MSRCSLPKFIVRDGPHDALPDCAPSDTCVRPTSFRTPSLTKYFSYGAPTLFWSQISSGSPQCRSTSDFLDLFPAEAWIPEAVFVLLYWMFASSMHFLLQVSPRQVQGSFGACFSVLGRSLVLGPPSNLYSILTSCFLVP
uniref:Uncharacterized protein n=1 Tax=Daucus carota subsp. sativus TaxID=79200 RepID=A0A161ZL61_DAUCS